jgi:TonB family protein
MTPPRSARRPTRLTWLCTGLLLLLGAARVEGQDSMAVARELYASAAYEDALAVLDRLSGRVPEPADAERRSIQQYRAFCLLALGRDDEAERAIESLVLVEPSFSPSAMEVSPRVRAAFADVRHRMLPAVIRHQYTEAKAAYDAGAFDAAAGRFRRVRDLLDDPDLRDAAGGQPLSDLRMLSDGFHALSVAAAAPPPPPLALVEEPPPAVPAIYAFTDADVVPPVTLHQALPAYTRETFSSVRGVLEVVIDEQGAVESAAIRASVDKGYDRLALTAAASWRYRPATLEGVPVKYRKLIQIALEPQR